MFGAIIKSWYAQILGVEPDKIYHVSFMPCTAKKYECDVECMNASGARDIDVVLTVRELDRLIKSEGIDVKSLEESEFDAPLGTASGAGRITHGLLFRYGQQPRPERVPICARL